MRIADVITGLCKEANMSLAALEKEIGIGKGTIYRWNENIPSADKLQKVADYFNVSVDYLLGREPSDEIEQMLEYLHKDPDMKVLLSSSAKLQKEDLEAVITIVKSMNRGRDNDD